ncbi:hypothetical protein Tco_1183192 [Tanacetum coccineum]
MVLYIGFSPMMFPWLSFVIFCATSLHHLILVLDQKLDKLNVVFDTATKTHSKRKPIANPNSPFSAGFERRRSFCSFRIGNAFSEVVVVGHLVSW